MYVILRKIYIMKYIIRSISTIIVLFVLIACTEKHNLKKIMTEFSKSEIVIPDTMFVVNAKESAWMSHNKSNDQKLIIYIDSTSCSACRIAHFIDMIPLYELADSLNNKFSVMAIFSPEMSKMADVELQLKLLDFQYPIYLDVEKEFAAKNTIPFDKRFHNFLISGDGKVKYVGNPLANEQLMTIFLSVL